MLKQTRVIVSGVALAKKLHYKYHQHMKTSVTNERGKRLARLASFEEQVNYAELLQCI